MSFIKERDVNSLSQVSINYIFFGFYFLFISIIHVYHIFLIENSLTFSRYFFLCYATVQCAIETLLFILFANAIKIFFHSKAMALYSIIVFFFMLTHVIDFPLVRFMDMSFWYALNFISAESPQNFLELLYASNVSLIVWFFSGLLGFAILFSGIFFYRISDRWTHKHPFIVQYSLLAAVLCTLCLFLMTRDYSTHKWVHRHHFDRYQKTLPWKSTFFHRHQEFISLSHPLQEPPSQEKLLQKIDPFLKLNKKPDIFLFVIESLREDYIDKVQTPHLDQFKKKFTKFDLALANANATQYSWFSLFYAQYPFYWGKINPKQWKGGSIPLILLKKMGYKIYCYSSARLNFYQMDRLIFGENTYLADEMLTFGSQYVDTPYIRDKKVVEKMIEEMEKNTSGGRMFIIFLDSTHHDYSWPKDMPSPFTPYEEKINYLKAALSNSDLEMIKNRYRNSLFFVDSLFGTFMEAFNGYSGKDEAVIVVSGDHGEEFYEEGHLFHASCLSQPQTHVPLYYKFGTGSDFEKKAHTHMTCQMDIFPTLFHYLTDKECMEGVLQGQSIFSLSRRNFMIMARYNASRSPCEFCIHNGTQKLTAVFSDERNIFNSKGVRVLSMKNMDDEIIPHDLQAVKEQFGNAFEQIFIP